MMTLLFILSPSAKPTSTLLLLFILSLFILSLLFLFSFFLFFFQCLSDLAAANPPGRYCGSDEHGAQYNKVHARGDHEEVGAEAVEPVVDVGIVARAHFSLFSLFHYGNKHAKNAFR
ncbi:MAG: hypothetical protein IKO12_08595 [Bacteroidaceae bacterium]|nr:hypothetical protein [Bacteroidaceae bacterium]